MREIGSADVRGRRVLGGLLSVSEHIPVQIGVTDLFIITPPPPRCCVFK